MKKTFKKIDLYQDVTDRIIEAIKADKVLPWQKPWSCTGGEMPQNMASKKTYRGINLLLLSLFGYSSCYWGTFKQVKELGGNVRKGEKGTRIVFWKMLRSTDKETGKEKLIPLLKNYTVFNFEQCDGLDPDKFGGATDELTDQPDPIEAAEMVIDGWKGKPEIRTGGDRACYSPSLDYIQVPPMSAFKAAGEYYSTVFHEMAHSTGHKNRLNRPELADGTFFGSHKYSQEELTAEFSAAFLCNTCGIETTLDNSTAYINGWLKKLNSNPKWLIAAAGKAQRAADMILGVSFGEKAEQA